MKCKLLQKTITKKNEKKPQTNKKKSQQLHDKYPKDKNTCHTKNKPWSEHRQSPTEYLSLSIHPPPPPPPISLSPYINISTGCLQKCTYRYNICIYTIITLIAFKGTIRDFLQSPHSASNCLQHVHSSGSGAIVCKSRATHRALTMCNMSCSMPLCTKGQPSY